MDIEREQKIVKWFLWTNIISSIFWFGPGMVLAIMYPKSILYVSIMSAFANGSSAVAAIMSTRTQHNQLKEQKAEADS